MKMLLMMIGPLALAAFAPMAYAETPSSVLRSLPTDVQKQIDNVRASCRELGSATPDYTPPRVTSGDEGLRTFTISGAQAVLIDALNLCGDGTHCIHGVNCATGFTHHIDIYVRSGRSWRKVFSKSATEPVFLSVDRRDDRFRVLVMSVHGGDEGCPVQDKSDPTAWKKEKCDFVVKWDGTKFVWKPL